MSWRDCYTAEETALDEAENGVFEVVGDLIDVELESEEFVSVANLLWCATITAEEMAVYLKDI